ncbi:hypothetical protein [Ferviditalea candida]|uniref:Uncharacterized protein n=1 Tax=Ferviditalea candida TaxID=3108399 RepID=A0ABU5ZKT3_9BACL|nr:hypothetical protein [Paenibacillaceae bacterium T2]
MTIIANTRISVGSGKKRTMYLPGQAISGLDKDEEQRLVDGGHARFPEVVKEEKKSTKENTEENGPNTGIPGVDQ